MIVGFVYTTHLMTVISGSNLTFPLIGIASFVLAMTLGTGLMIDATKKSIFINVSHGLDLKQGAGSLANLPWHQTSEEPRKVHHSKTIGSDLG
jgi:hypothetical protein